METRYGDPASRIIRGELAGPQLEDLQRLTRHATHLKHDLLSPDSVKVLTTSGWSGGSAGVGSVRVLFCEPCSESGTGCLPLTLRRLRSGPRVHGSVLALYPRRGLPFLSANHG